jgi:Bacteriophage tail sheath protein
MAIGSEQSVPPARSSRGSYPIPLNVTTTVGFLGRTERGPIDEPVIVESFPEFCRYFGGHFAEGAVSYAVHDFFLHGGRRAVIVRVANRATRARIDIPTADGALNLQARYPGRHEVLRVSIDYEQVESDDCMFNLVVQRLGLSGSSLVEDQELYPMISTRPNDARFIGDVLGDSRLIALAGPPPATRPLATPPKWPGDPVRYIGASVAGNDGDELTDYDIVGSDRNGTGLFAFSRGPRIDLLAIPLAGERELGMTAFLAAARFCEHERALLIWDPPCHWQSADAAILGSRRLDFRSGNVMTYFPRIRPRGARARYAGGMPASGAIAGMLAQRDRRGLFGLDGDTDYSLRAALVPVLDLSPRDSQRLARYGVNSFAPARGGTMRLIGRVTLGAAGLGSAASGSLERRRLSFFILNSIEDAALAATRDSYRDAALLRLEGQLTRFFDELFEHGALAGKTPAQAFYLHTDFGTNGARPARAIRLGFSLNEPGRFLEYRIAIDGPRAGKLERIRALEAQQLFS